MDSQDLVTLRSLLYVGCHQKVATEAKSLNNLDKKLAIIRDSYVYRSLVALGKFKEVFSAVDKLAPAALQAVKLLATYSSTARDDRDMVFETLKEWLADPTIASDPTVRLLASQIFFESQEYKQALKLVIDGDNLEMKAMTIQIYLAMDRVDLASSTLRQMMEIDDDDTLTSLATVWVYIAQRGDKAKEAFDILQELQEKYGSTVDLLNTMAVCLMHQRNFSSAFQNLKSARDLAIQEQQKASPTTLINSVVCLQQLGKPQAIVDRVIGELKQNSPNHPWLQKQQELEELFEKSTSATE